MRATTNAAAIVANQYQKKGEIDLLETALDVAGGEAIGAGMGKLQGKSKTIRQLGKNRTALRGSQTRRNGRIDYLVE